jgi:4'-phosphopantetheinyl transferase
MEVGIDIEIKHQVTVSDFRSQMISTEWERIVTAEDEMAAFYKYWTEKEAVIKAYGFGLSIPLQSFEIVNSCTNVNGRPFFLREIVVDQNYVCHLATGEKLSGEQVILERGYY